MKVGIIGCGRFGSCLATYLAERGTEVLALDHNHEVVQRMSAVVSRMAEGDATDEAVLAEAGFGECDAVVIAIGANMEASILAAMTLKEMKVPCILAKAETDTHGKVLERIGVNRVLYPDRDLASRVARLLVMPTILDYVEITEGAGVIEVKPPDRMIGKTIAKSDIRKLHGVIVLALEKQKSSRDGRRVILVPGPDDVIEDGDVLVLFGPDQKLRQLDHSLIG